MDCVVLYVCVVGDEIVRVTLHKEEGGVDNPPFGLNIRTKPGGHRVSR